MPTPDEQDKATWIKSLWTMATTLFTGAVERRMVVWMLFIYFGLVPIATGLAHEAIATYIPSAFPTFTVIEPEWGEQVWTVPATREGWEVLSTESRLVTRTSLNPPWIAGHVPLTGLGTDFYQLQARVSVRHSTGVERTVDLHSAWWAQ